jgi:capsular polysaccharide biosynthesis protein
MMRNSDYLKILRDSWPIVLISTITFTGVGALATPGSSPDYASTATLAVTACVALEQTAGCDPIRGTGFALQRSQIYSTLGTTAPVLNRAIALVDFEVDADDLRIGTAVTSEASSPIVEVKVVWPVPDQSIELANAVALALIDYAAVTIDNMPTEVGSTDFFVAEQAVRTVKASPASVSLTTVGLVLGLAFGLGIALLRYVLDRRLRSSGEGESVTGLDDLATIPVAPFPSKHGSYPQPWMDSSADAFRRLRTGVLVRTAAVQGRTVLVASSQPGESSSYVARGLADSLVETGARVLLVEVDLDLERKNEVTGSDANGLPSELELAPSTRNMYQAGESSLQILSATDLQSVRSATLGATKVDALVTFDYVVMSAPPLLPTANGVSLIPMSDVVLLVAGLRVVKKDDLEAAVRSISLAGGTPIGITTTFQVSAKTHAKLAR